MMLSKILLRRFCSSNLYSNYISQLICCHILFVRRKIRLIESEHSTARKHRTWKLVQIILNISTLLKIRCRFGRVSKHQELLRHGALSSDWSMCINRINFEHYDLQDQDYILKFDSSSENAQIHCHTSSNIHLQTPDCCKRWMYLNSTPIISCMCSALNRDNYPEKSIRARCQENKLK